MRELRTNDDQAEIGDLEILDLLLSELGESAAFLTDSDGVIVSWNASVERAFGYQESEFMRKPSSILFTAEDQASGAPDKDREIARRNGRAVAFRWYRHKNGSAVLKENRLLVRKGPDGQGLGFAWLMFDAGFAQTALRESEERLALSTTPDFTYTFDLDGRFTYVNRALLSLWQKPLAEAIGKNFFELGYPPELAARLQNQIQQVIDTRQPLRDRTPFTGPTGETRFYEYIFVPVIDANQVEAVTGSTRDITEQKRFEEKERESQEQLRERARLESLGVMAGGIAHDFNNLLVGILGNASLLVEMAPEKERPFASEIVLAAERAADLTNQMLAYSGRGQFATEILDVNQLIRDNLTLLRATISRSVSLELDLSADDCFIEADRGQIQQIVMNLLINASEAIGNSPGIIGIRTKLIDRTAAQTSERLHSQVAPGCYVRVDVADNGSGMSPETQKRIFDPFFSTKFTGRGLGLAAVLGIVKGHEGDIDVVSRPGAGATFTVLLPVCERARTEHRDSKPSPEPEAARGTVMVVDDEEIVLRTASAALRSRGFRAVTAPGASEALDILRGGSEISLVILDLTMPVMTGEQAIPLIKQIRPELPIILSSGYSEAEIVRRFSSAGIADVLQKPYTVDELLSRVNRVLHAIERVTVE